MRVIYNILFTIGLLLTSPYYFYRLWRRRQWRDGFTERFGKYSTRTKSNLTNRRILWLHAVSVGEVNICTQLIHALEPRTPNLKMVVSTTTTTGMAQLQQKLPAHIEKIYYPIDRYRFVQRAFAAFHPEAVVLVEAEIWPNFLWHARRRNVPTFLVNARLSDRSFKNYRRFGFIFRSIFASFSGVGVQNETDAQRMIQLGCRPEAIRVVGNLKFDAAKLVERRLLDVPHLLSKVGVNFETQPILVAGSTHAGEESILADIYLRLRKKIPNLFLVVVPRHFERSKAVVKELTAKGLTIALRSDLTVSVNYDPGTISCLLVNTTGELRYFYEYATVIFVGKSLTAEGGQSPIEPGSLGKAMIFGPNMQNFAPIAADFVAKGGAIQVPNATELEKQLENMLTNPDLREQLGTNAAKVVQDNRGSIGRTVDMIIEHLDEHLVV
jgi:3-deoxy-D-manno-octulosonic-acid transferase